MKVILLNPETEETYDEAVEIIAKVMGKEDISEQYFTYRKDLFAKYVKEQEEKKTVYFAGSDILETCGSDMFQNELIQDAQGSYVLNEQLKGVSTWQKINVEELIQADPDYIFIEQGGISVDDVLNNSALSDISAVKNHHVYIFPSEYETWDTPNLSSCLGVLWMYAILYPDALSMEDVANEANAFYQTYYGFDADMTFCIMKKQLLLAGSLLILLWISLICGRYSASAWEVQLALSCMEAVPLLERSYFKFACRGSCL